MRVLIIDEDPTTRGHLVDNLSEWGYQPYALGDGKGAYEAVVGEDTPKIVLVSASLNDVDGMDICRRIRSSSAGESTYLILMISRQRIREELGNIEACADDYLSRPVFVDELKMRVRLGARITELRNAPAPEPVIVMETAPTDELEATISLLKKSVADLEQSNHDLKQSNCELKSSRSRIVDVFEQIRRETASYLHGKVQTDMSLVFFKMQDLQKEIEPLSEQLALDLSLIAEELDDIREHEIRGLSHRLHPSRVTLGLTPSLRALEMQHGKAMPIELDLDEKIVESEPIGRSSLPLHARLGAYRVAEQAIVRAVKARDRHAVAIRVWMEDDDERLCISVEGGNSSLIEQESSNAAVPLEDYVSAVGGHFEAMPVNGMSSIVRASFPLEQPVH